MKIIHLSDLHFGTVEGDIAEDLLASVTDIKPDLVIISGDFTQIASRAEFQTARAFLKKFTAPVFCVPGNHDIPRYDLWERFFTPYKKYKEYIDRDLYPVFENDHAVIAGINSARRALLHWNWANGAISAAQLEHLEDVYKSRGNKKHRICVFHHPIQKALDAPMNTTVFGAQKALARLNDLEVDLVLTGHVHHASIISLGDTDHKTVYLSASTALSSRLREQENGFNVIDMGQKKMNIRLYAHNGEHFNVTERFQQNLKQ